MKKKLSFLALGMFALIGLVSFGKSVYLNGSVHAQAPQATVAPATAPDTDKETQDDVVSPNPAQNTTVQPKNDANENDKADVGTTPEVEDGN